MKQIDRLRMKIKQESKCRERMEIEQVFRRMSMDQLLEIVYGNPSDSRLHDILESVDGLHLLESG